MEKSKTLQQQFQEMNDTDLAFWHQVFFSIIDGLQAENTLIEMGGSFAKTENEADRYIDDFSYNQVKIKHYQVYVDYTSLILAERAKNHAERNPLSAVCVGNEEQNFYKDSSLVSLFCSYQIFTGVVAEIKKVEKLITDLQTTVPGKNNERVLPRLWSFHMSFISKMKEIVTIMLNRKGEQ